MKYCPVKNEAFFYYGSSKKLKFAIARFKDNECNVADIVCPELKDEFDEPDYYRNRVLVYKKNSKDENEGEENS
jgi:hypothetical protein